MSKACTWGAILLLTLTLSVGIVSQTRTVKAGWGMASILLLVGGWLSRHSMVWMGRRVRLSEEALQLAYAEQQIDQWVPAVPKGVGDGTRAGVKEAEALSPELLEDQTG